MDLAMEFLIEIPMFFQWFNGIFEDISKEISMEMSRALTLSMSLKFSLALVLVSSHFEHFQETYLPKTILMTGI